MKPTSERMLKVATEQRIRTPAIWTILKDFAGETKELEDKCAALEQDRDQIAIWLSNTLKELYSKGENVNVQAEQIADEMEFTDFQKRLHKSQLEDAYKQATDAFTLLGEAKRELNLVDITYALDGKLDLEVINRVKAMVTKIDKFLAEKNPR